MVEEVFEKARNRSTSLGGNWVEMVATYEENMGKTYERLPSPGGTWEEMVSQSRINLKLASLGQSSSQETQETVGLGPSQSTRGRKSQKQQREQEVERELELGRKIGIEVTKLLQNVKATGSRDFIPQAGSHATKK